MSKQNKAIIYVVRHAESEGNAGILRKEHHKLGSELTNQGKKQAKNLSRVLKNIVFDKIFSSDLARTQQTAEILALERKIEIETTSLIRERSFQNYVKSFTNKTEEELSQEIRKNLEKLDEKAKMQYKHSPSMESAQEAATRLLNFIKEIAVAYQGKTILVVAHGNIMRSLLTHLGYAKYDELPNGAIENTGFFVLESNGEEFNIINTHGIIKSTGVVRKF